MSDKDKKLELIKSINNDKTLSSSEKNRRLQELFNGPAYRQIIKESGKSNFSLTCKHYKKGCSRLHFACCDIYDPCNRCHNEKTSCSLLSPKINSVICNQCDFEQEPGRVCVNCNHEFSVNYCDICKVWHNQEIFHCYDCGTCKLGRIDDMFHCHTCEACFNLAAKEKHVCAKSSFKETECPICLESVLTAQKGSKILKCGHVVHIECIRGYELRQNSSCPICKKTYKDMSAIWRGYRFNVQRNRIPDNILQIPPGEIARSPLGNFLVEKMEMVNATEMYTGLIFDTNIKATFNRNSLKYRKYIKVFCYDCECESQVEFNFLGYYECKRCLGFNTAKS